MSLRIPTAGRIGFLLRDEARTWGLAWAGVFCLGDARAGGLVSMLVIAGLSATRPSAALGGFLCVVAGRLFERLLGRKSELRMAINCLLLGLGVGYGFHAGPAFVFLCLIAAAYVGLVSGPMARVGSMSGLPILSLPFATGYILLQCAAPRLGGVAAHEWAAMRPLWPAFDAALPALPRAFFTNLGLLFFVPDALVGAGIFLVILSRSRLLALHGFLAFAVAAAMLGRLGGNPEAAAGGPSGFNFILVGFALGAFFLLPSWGSLAWSSLVSGVCVFVTLGLGAALGRLGSSPGTLPFNLVVILTLALLRRSGSPLIPFRHRRTPEETLDAETCSRVRLGSGPSIALPFSGTCRVYQAFDGPWTHRGAWRHAYDFVKCGEDGRSHRNAGLELADYHLFDLEVLAPCSGVVVACRDDLPDNRPGLIDPVNNWGNFIILRESSGLHVELSHLKNGSLRVKTGDEVRTGRVLARCGNSGYSLYPHLHVQVQTGPWLGDETVPFTFAHAHHSGRLHHACLPPVGADVRAPGFAATPSPFAFTPGEVLVFDRERPGRKTERCRWTVRRTPDVFGRLYLDDAAGNTLHFVTDHSGYTAPEYSGDPGAALAFFALALPRLPNLAGGARWRDAVPLALCAGFFRREWRTFARVFGMPGCRAGVPPRGLWTLDDDRRRLRVKISGHPVITVSFDERRRLISLSSTTQRLTRKLP